MAMTPCENFAKKRLPKKVMLDSSFAGVKAGMMLYVGTPQIVAAYIEAIPAGQTATIARMRNELARRNKCDAMCPVSTAIFVRIAAEHAIAELDQGKLASEVIPFWRIVEPGSKLAGKLARDEQFIAMMLASERAGLPKLQWHLHQDRRWREYLLAAPGTDAMGFRLHRPGRGSFQGRPEGSHPLHLRVATTHQSPAPAQFKLSQ